MVAVAVQKLVMNRPKGFYYGVWIIPVPIAISNKKG
jgi:hypothetical protein